jgi:hypothetical protein
LFEFMKAMDTLKKSLTSDTSVVLTTEGDLFRYLKSPAANTTIKSTPAAPKPTPPPAPSPVPAPAPAPAAQ